MNSARERVRQALGPKLADGMLAFESEHAGLRVWGFVAASHESFATARGIHTFVNGRAVRDRMLVRAIEQAYQTLIPRGRHPAAVLFIEPRPEEIDVNVHPMKTEVRFRNSGEVFETVYRAVRDRFADQTESQRIGSSDFTEALASPANAASEASGEPLAARPINAAPPSPGALARAGPPCAWFRYAPTRAATQLALGLAYDRGDIARRRGASASRFRTDLFAAARDRTAICRIYRAGR